MIVALDVQLAVGTATGVGVYQRDLAAALAAQGVAVRPLRATWLDPWRFDRRVAWDQVLLPLAAARSGAHLLHASSGTLPLVRTLPAVVTVHDMAWLRVQDHTAAYARAYFGALMRHAYRRARAVVVDSAFSRDEYAALSGDPRPATVVPPGVDARFAAIVRRPDAAPFALVAGTVERRKNLMRAVETIASVPALRLCAVGPPTPYAADVRARAAELGVADRVALLGYVERAVLDDLYARAALALVPSNYEGFGYAVAEARCAGLPFVAARGSALVEVAGDAGTLVDAGDAGGWVTAVRAILADRAAAQARADAGRGAALARFGWEAAAAALRDVYERALSG
ncbi:MAG: glycosyltransferase family 4 protein [Candidatus Velthaea sp.]